MTVGKPLKIAILWHMHQPMYCEPFSKRLVLPWVRFHALKDYLDMPLAAAKYENVRVTFNLVPSLLDQIAIYSSGGSDPHLELSRIPAEDLSESQRRDLLNTFFSCPAATMIDPYDRYAELHRKAKDSYHQSILPRLFTVEELRDLQVWSNLVWIDPVFREQEPVRSLFNKGRQYSEEEKYQLLDWQLALMSRVIPTYKDLFARECIDVSFTPYYHPILPLLCDTDVAREAVPNMGLPANRFMHPEDAESQIRQSMAMFESIFGSRMKGMWPSEGSVSPEVAALAEKLGLEWIATDEEILTHSWKKAGKEPPHLSQYRISSLGKLKLFFRDHALSDRIGFVYSGWDSGRAVEDFISALHRIRVSCENQLDHTVVPVILDGENAWEYFKNDGTEFLDELYRRLSDDPLIETVTMTRAAEQMHADPLPALFAGSWINHNFRIWIGHDEDNRAWDLLHLTREALVAFQIANPGFDPTRLENAWKQIYIAEGSDWCWWYGDDHRGPNNVEFDAIYRRHLAAAFEYVGLPVPAEIRIPIHRKTVSSLVVAPENHVTPVVDGRLTHFYEWAGAGTYDCGQAGTTMHRVDRILDHIYFAYDSEFVHVRLDFADFGQLAEFREPTCVIRLNGDSLAEILVPLKKGAIGNSGKSTFAVDEIVEISARRDEVFTAAAGKLLITITILDNDKQVESWPENDELAVTIPETAHEMFWPF